jgi:hypothetical protein
MRAEDEKTPVESVAHDEGAAREGNPAWIRKRASRGSAACPQRRCRRCREARFCSCRRRLRARPREGRFQGQPPRSVTNASSCACLCERCERARYHASGARRSRARRGAISRRAPSQTRPRARRPPFRRLPALPGTTALFARRTPRASRTAPAARERVDGRPRSSRQIPRSEGRRSSHSKGGRWMRALRAEGARSAWRREATCAEKRRHCRAGGN